MTPTVTFAIIIVAVALSFDFLNGFHDAANSIATVVSTRVLSPRVAVLWAAFFNFVAAFTFGTAVARTMGKGMIRLEAVNLYVILAGLLGAIFWDILTWYYGLPVSSSHALIGGYAGAAIAKAGWGRHPYERVDQGARFHHYLPNHRIHSRRHSDVRCLLDISIVVAPAP